MFGIFSRFRTSTKSTKKAQKHVRLALEALETRYCPSPYFTALNATPLANHQVRLSGSIYDNNEAGINLTFSGAASGTTTTDSSGNFNYTTSNASLGNVVVVAVDQDNQASSDNTSLAVSGPSVYVTDIQYGQNYATTMTGIVQNLDQGGRTVTLSGALSGSVVTDANGNFTFSGTASGKGTVALSVTDLWGSTGSYREDLTPPPPTMTLSAAGNGSTVWTFSGQITDWGNTENLTVTFSGLPEVQGQTATVDAQGHFFLTEQLQANEYGYSMANFTDVFGATAGAGDYVST